MKKILALLVLAFSWSAHAVVISDTINPDGVAYTYFSIDSDAAIHLETLNGQFDPYMYLFTNDGSLDTGDVLAFDDDSGSAAVSFRNSLINMFLTAGSYIVAVGDFHLTPEEAVSGFADNSYSSLGGGYDLLISGNTNITISSSVPEPSSLILLALGIAGLGFARRKSNA